MFVKPLDGLLIRDPQTRLPLPKEGADVPDTGFWRRRLRDKSIEAAAAPAASDVKAEMPQPPEN